MGTKLMEVPLRIKRFSGGKERWVMLKIEGRELTREEVCKVYDVILEYLFEDKDLQEEAMKSAAKWATKAKGNTGKWGFQGKPRLLLAMMEELGELTKEYLEYTDYSIEQQTGAEGNEKKKRMDEELIDLAALLIQFRWRSLG